MLPTGFNNDKFMTHYIRLCKNIVQLVRNDILTDSVLLNVQSALL